MKLSDTRFLLALTTAPSDASELERLSESAFFRFVLYGRHERQGARHAWPYGSP